MLMNNGFVPAYMPPLEYYTQALEELCEKERRLNANMKEILCEKNSLEKYGKLSRGEKREIWKRMGVTHAELTRISETKKKLRAELSQRMEALSRKPFADDAVQPYNECVGYCYGKCIYVDMEGEFRYRLADVEDADKLGDTVDGTEALTYLNTLPEAEITMILTYLKEARETPMWVIRLIEIEKE